MYLTVETNNKTYRIENCNLLKLLEFIWKQFFQEEYFWSYALVTTSLKYATLARTQKIYNAKIEVDRSQYYTSIFFYGVNGASIAYNVIAYSIKYYKRQNKETLMLSAEKVLKTKKLLEDFSLEQKCLEFRNSSVVEGTEELIQKIRRHFNL